MPDEVHLTPMSPKHPKIQGQKHSRVSSSKHLILRNKDTINGLEKQKSRSPIGNRIHNVFFFMNNRIHNVGNVMHFKRKLKRNRKNMKQRMMHERRQLSNWSCICKGLH